ncbi:MAG: TolC family protein [Candidatus Obscuribacterales bacterium]
MTRRRDTTRFVRLCTCIVLLWFGVSQTSCFAQDSSSNQPIVITPSTRIGTPLTLQGAIEMSHRNYPAIRSASLRADAAKEGITQAKTAYLPHADIMFDENYGTANNITGFLAPQMIVPNISGQVQNKNNFLGGFGFTSGALISWEPFDFGLRKAQVRVAQSTTRRTQAQIVISELDAMSRAADAFLSVLAAQQVMKASRAKVDRLNVFLETVHVLAQQQLKPTTDEYLAQAELVRAKDELIMAEQNYKIAQAALVKWTGLGLEEVEVDAGPLLRQVPETHFQPADLSSHPQALAQNAAIDLVHARKHALERTYFPKFYLRLPVYARGSSFNPDLTKDFGKGYYPTTFNYAISGLILFPAMDIFQLRAQRRAESKNELAERARYDEIMLNLKEQDAQARAMIEASIRIAENAPIKVKASQEAANSARIRYRYQLASVNDVALDEQLLTQSEVEYATAQLQVWRALLAAAVARGSMKPFVDQVLSATLQRR